MLSKVKCKFGRNSLCKGGCHAAENKLTVQALEEFVENELLNAKREENVSEVTISHKQGAFDAFQQEKDMMDVVRNLRRKVEFWNKAGKSASMSVSNGLRVVEITLRFAKNDVEA